MLKQLLRNKVFRIAGVMAIATTTAVAVQPSPAQAACGRLSWPSPTSSFGYVTNCFNSNRAARVGTQDAAFSGYICFRGGQTQTFDRYYVRVDILPNVFC